MELLCYTLKKYCYKHVCLKDQITLIKQVTMHDKILIVQSHIDTSFIGENLLLGISIGSVSFFSVSVKPYSIIQVSIA